MARGLDRHERAKVFGRCPDRDIHLDVEVVTNAIGALSVS